MTLDCRYASHPFDASPPTNGKPRESRSGSGRYCGIPAASRTGSRYSYLTASTAVIGAMTPSMAATRTTCGKSFAVLTSSPWQTASSALKKPRPRRTIRRQVRHRTAPHALGGPALSQGLTGGRGRTLAALGRARKAMSAGTNSNKEAKESRSQSNLQPYKKCASNCWE